MVKIIPRQPKFIESICTMILFGMFFIVSDSVSANESVSCYSDNTRAGALACFKLTSSLIVLPAEAVHKLKINAGFGWGIFSSSIFNSNENYFVTQLIISMVPMHSYHHLDTYHATMSHDSKIYHINLELPPVSKGALSIPLPGEGAHIHEFKWRIVKVMDYQLN